MNRFPTTVVPSALKDRRVLVAIVIVGVEACVFRVVDQSPWPGRPVGAPGEDAAASEFFSPATSKHYRLRRVRRPAELPAGFRGEVEELSFADHLGTGAGDDLQVTCRRNDAFPSAPAREMRRSPEKRLTTANVSSSHQAGGRIELVNTLTG